MMLNVVAGNARACYRFGMDDPGQESSDEVIAMHCPHCGIAVEVTVRQAGTEVSCPDCREVFEVRLEGEGREAPAVKEKLDALRVRQMMLARRAVYRGWGFMMFGAGICVVSAVQLLFNAYKAIRDGASRDWVVLYTAVAVLLIVLAAKLWVRGKQLKREVEKPMLEPPAAPPDFTGLSDGTQHAQNLERMRKE